MEKQKNIPQLRFPEFKGEWESIKLGDYISITSGNSPSLYDLSDEGIYPFLKVEELNNCDKYQINSRFYTNDSKNLIEENSIIFPKRGAAILINKIRINAVPAQMDSNLMAIKPNNENLNHEFLFYVINKEKLYKIADTSTIPQINNKHIEPYRFYIPKRDEQIKIATFFTSIDQKITQLKRKKTLLEQYKKGVMQKIFSQEIRFKDDNGQEFPKWEKKRLGEVLIEHKTVNSENRFNEVFSVAKHKGVINQIEHLGRSFSAKDISNYKVINPHDIVYTKSPTSDFPFGIIKQNLLDRSGVVSPLYGVFKPETNALGFLLHNFFLSWINTYNYLNPLVQKGAKNTMNINNDDFLNGAKIPLPVSEVEQTKIANFLSAIDNKINHIQKQIEKVEVWKKGLMQQMFV